MLTTTPTTGGAGAHVPEVLVVFDQPIKGPGGQNFFAQVCGRSVNDLWEGWIEFQSSDGELTVGTPRETEQPNRNDLEYWAQGLTETYLQGALNRALRCERSIPRHLHIDSTPFFEKPAELFTYSPPLSAEPVLDPFAVYVQGEHILRDQLLALSPDHVRNIIKTYRLEASQGETQREVVESVIAQIRRRQNE